jgi:hypothetical protein
MRNLRDRLESHERNSTAVNVSRLGVGLNAQSMNKNEDGQASLKTDRKARMITGIPSYDEDLVNDILIYINLTMNTAS